MVKVHRGEWGKSGRRGKSGLPNSTDSTAHAQKYERCRRKQSADGDYEL